MRNLVEKHSMLPLERGGGSNVRQHRGNTQVFLLRFICMLVQVYVSPSTVMNHLRDADLIQFINSTSILWTVYVDEMVLSFYDTKLRSNPRLRWSCTNRPVLNDTIDKWKIEQHLVGRAIRNTSPSTFD